MLPIYTPQLQTVELKWLREAIEFEAWFGNKHYSSSSSKGKQIMYVLATLPHGEGEKLLDQALPQLKLIVKA